jgi:glucose-1-phosphate thymidylyltransferase
VLLEGVARFVSEFERTRPDAQIFVAQVAEPEHFGVVELKDGNAVRLVEKPREFVSDLALVGVYLFDDSILEACATLSPSWRGEYEITEAIQWLIDRGKTVRVEMLDGWWKDTGRPEDLLEANRMLLAARQGPEVDGVVVAPDAQVSDSRLIGPVVIGPGCRIEGSSIGPDVSLEAGCTVIDSTIRDSIVMQGCSINGVESLERSILGRNVEVRHAVGRNAHRLVVGDQSVVEVD